MQFQINTPQTIGACLAKKASKRKSAQGSDREPSSKKQEFLKSSRPSAPAQSENYALIVHRPTEEGVGLVDPSLPPAQTQAHNATDLGPITKRRKSDDCSVVPDRVHSVVNHGLGNQKSDLDHGSLPPADAQLHNGTDLGPATTKQRLSYANLPPARVRKRISVEEAERIRAYFLRRRFESWCGRNGLDSQFISEIPDDVLRSSSFNLHNYLLCQSSGGRSDDRALELDGYPVDDSPAKDLTTAEVLKPDTHHFLDQQFPSPSRLSPAPNPETHMRSVTGVESLCYAPAQDLVSKMAAEASSVFDRNLDELYPYLSDQTSIPLSLNSTLGRSICHSSDAIMERNITDTHSDKIVSVSSDHDIGDDRVAARLDQVNSIISGRDMADDIAATTRSQIGSSVPGTTRRDDTSLAATSQIPAVRPPRNKGGRPKTKESDSPRKFKGPARFQKNHPVKARVNIDIWENILLLCPPDFLLKARTISSTFRSVLKDDSHIWKRARINHFGPDMPDPPLGLSEPQYADLLTGTGCHTRGCDSKLARKTYWVFQKRLCLKCFHKAFLPPRALRRVFKELESSGIPQYRSIAHYYRSMEEFLPGMKFDRWDNYQWLGDYDPTPSWGQQYRSGQYTAFPAAAYATLSSELARFVGNQYDVENGRFCSSQPMLGKTCPPQDEVDAWFDAKQAINEALVTELQAVEDWYERDKRKNQRVGKDLRMDRERFYKEQAELAGMDKSVLGNFDSYQAAIAISKPPSMQSWKILLPKLMAECEAAQKCMAEREAEKKLDEEIRREWTVEKRDETYGGFPFMQNVIHHQNHIDSGLTGQRR